jgi:multisubunit Na+/H+ antiporter MnhG subunit
MSLNSNFNVSIGVEDKFTSPLKGLQQHFKSIKGESNQAFKSIDLMSRDSLGNLNQARIQFAEAGSEVSLAASTLGGISFGAVALGVLAVAGAATIAVTQIISNISSQMQTADTLTVAQFQGAQGLSIATGQSLESAQSLLESGSKDIQKIAAKLPGATSDYVQSFSALSPAVATLIRDQSGNIDKALFKSTLEKSAEVAVIFGQSSKVGTDMGNAALNKLMSGQTGFNTVLRNDFFEKNVALTQALKTSLAKSKINPSDWGKITGMQRAEVLNKAFNTVLSKDAIKVFSKTLDGIYQGFVSQFYFVQTETKVGNQITTSYKEYVRAFGAVFGEEGVINQLLRISGINTQSIADTVTPWLASVADNFTLLASALSQAKNLADIPKVLSAQFEGVVFRIQSLFTFQNFSLKSFNLSKIIYTSISTSFTSLTTFLSTGLPILFKNLSENLPVVIDKLSTQIAVSIIKFPSLFENSSVLDIGSTLGKLVPVIASMLAKVTWSLGVAVVKIILAVGISLIQGIFKIGVFLSGSIYGAVTSVAASLVDGFKTIWSSVSTTITDFFAPITNAIIQMKSAFDSITGWVNSKVTEITELASKLPGVNKMVNAEPPTITQSAADNRYSGQNIGSLKNAYSGLNIALNTEKRMEPTARPVIANSSEIIIPKGRQSEIANKSFTFSPTIIIKESINESEVLSLLNSAWSRFKLAAT